ncbi:division-specific transpeptidase [Klebsiella pneumoniae]|uniref:Division-specific transpeptidase n=1 Tax=Klebsiella pneumoniae TaxID=573 RepID=A0A377XDV9_KLEPN|nr:division-specific transpeptidase [Klebsiella pneumoniae]
MPDGMPQGAENLIVMHDSHPQGPGAVTVVCRGE